MKTFTLIVVASIAVGATAAKADFWFDGPPVFVAPYDGDAHSGGPYVVAGFGDDHAIGQPRYWGAPYWTMCRGPYPPFQTHRIPPASCRALAVKVDARHHPRVVRARLK